MKIGIILCAYGYPDYVDKCLAPWIEASKKHDIVIAAVHGQFEEYHNNGVSDNDWNTLNKLDEHLTKGNLKFLYAQNRPNASSVKYEKEHIVRNYAAQYLHENNVDVFWLLDLDEFYTVEQIDNIVRFINRPENSFYPIFKIHFRNIVFDGTKYVKGFCPSRIWRDTYKSFKFAGLHWDNDASYLDTETKTTLVRDSSLPFKKIPESLVAVDHFTWLHSNGKPKVEYQLKHFGHCGYRWNSVNNVLEFDTDFHAKHGIPIPVLHTV